MKKLYIKPSVQTEALEFGVFGSYYLPGNNGKGNANGWKKKKDKGTNTNNPNATGNNGTDHGPDWKHRNP